jgi:hypothetical protein
MRVKFLNRKIVLIKIKNKEDIVKWMMKNDYLQNVEGVSDFMYEYSQRKKLYENQQIRDDSVDHFIEDLSKNGIIEIIENKAS